MENEILNKKPFYKSKTVITAAIMLLTFIIDAAFQLGISDTIDSQLNNIFHTNEAGEVTKINWSALITLVSMLSLRLITKKPVSLTIPLNKKKGDQPGRDLLESLKNIRENIKDK